MRRASSESNLSSGGLARGRSGYFAIWIASRRSSSSSGVKFNVFRTTSFGLVEGRSTVSLITSSVSLTTCGRVARNRSSDPTSATLLNEGISDRLVVFHNFGRQCTIPLRSVGLSCVLQDRLSCQRRLGKSDRVCDPEVVDLVAVFLANCREHLLGMEGTVLV